MTIPASAQSSDSVTTQMTVTMPYPTAKLTIDETATTTTGVERIFETPRLTAGKRYQYKLTAVWSPNNYTTITRTRTVEFVAGTPFRVDLRPKEDSQPDSIVIRYVPTPQVVVNRMLELAGVKEGDIVYDLGCGDGRIVVTAVSKFGAKRGVGIDLDPERIADSKKTAASAKVGDRVEFRQADVLKIPDYSDASVVMLYMGNDLNLQLRPILQKSLKPGSRIVSHRFTMGDWKPDQTITMKDETGEQFLLHLWTIRGDELTPRKSPK
ncbi:TIGR03000 domain-containing protein [Tuwongella immobilis]|uniref:TIGR03000 domain-containing protein n=1 Tax=Tuwongella immobilis TaxID=692036 RepID=UPI0013A6E77A|nr:TIGR03000 domain-containing protein [Tuwongella immobilis]